MGDEHLPQRFSQGDVGGHSGGQGHDGVNYCLALLFHAEKVSVWEGCTLVVVEVDVVVIGVAGGDVVGMGQFSDGVARDAVNPGRAEVNGYA